MAGSVLGNRTRNFVLRLVVNGAKFTQSEVPNGTALPWVIEKLPIWHIKIGKMLVSEFPIVRGLMNCPIHTVQALVDERVCNACRKHRRSRGLATFSTMHPL